jgi:exosortase B
MDQATTLAVSPISMGRDVLIRYWAIILGVVVLAIPTFASLASEVWSTEAGVHGPIVLATGAWLFWRAWPEVRSYQQPGSPLIGWPMLVIALLLYVFGRAFSFISLEAAGLLGVLISIAFLYLGPKLLRHLWFPILYLGFLVPLPGWFVDGITAPLKEFISSSATWMLAKAGYPIAREGVTLYVAHYQLLVEDACSGLNSLVSLTSISLFYIYLLHNASWRYSIVLLFWILPAALFANLLRVIMLVLITYHFGDAAAQGFLHSAAGMVMFVAALLTIFLIDTLLTPLRRRLMGASA